MLWTAVAIAETGQIAQANNHDFTIVSADARAVSRFGMGVSFLQVPAALIAPVVESHLGPGTSQPLFLVFPILLVLAAAASAAAAVRLLGGDHAQQRAAIFLAGLGSPLASYAATSFSEPLQAAALTGAYAASIWSAMEEDPRRAARRAALAGVLASMAVLAKSLAFALVPVVLIPLLARRPLRQALRCLTVAGAAMLPGCGLWLWFEVSRFGRPFGGYPGEGFSHPVLDGLWRLTVGPNLGLLWYFPGTALALWFVLTAPGAQRVRRALCTLPTVGAAGALLALAAGWWAWHGVWGWGPRLLIPGVPLLAVGAACATATWSPWPRRALIVLSMAINLPGLVQHPTPVAAYTANLVWPTVDDALAGQVASYALRSEGGVRRVSPDHVLATVPRASPLVVFPWFRYAVGWDASAAGSRLAEPPWIDAQPDLVPREAPLSRELLTQIGATPRLPGWGRGFFGSHADARYAAVFDEGLADQVLRLQQSEDYAGALRLARKLVRVAPLGEHDALVLETFRFMGASEEARQYLLGLPHERRLSPEINVVLALFARDAGDYDGARTFLQSVAWRYPAGAPLHRALASPPASWPTSLQSMLEDPVSPAGGDGPRRP